MTRLVLALVPLAVALSWLLTLLVRRASARFQLIDSPGVAGQVKELRRVPNTGGVAIFWTIALPILAGVLGIAWLGSGDALPEALAPLHEHLAGIRTQVPLALLLVGAMLVLHVMGLIDDRRALGPWLKLAIIAVPSLAIPIFSDTRLLTLLDNYAVGQAGSIVLTALWFIVIINAMNFLDNMDGLSAGTAAIACACFLASNLGSPSPQWFVGACQALVIGACLGFLWFNFPLWGGGRASIYMGDGGSLVLGFLIAFLTVRMTYVGRGVREFLMNSASTAEIVHASDSHWHKALIPLVVLAIPLYDFCSVVLIRLRQGKSPFVGDTQHFSHRLVKLGLSRKAAVLVIWALVAVTGFSGLLMPVLMPWQMVIIGVQTLLVLAVLAMLERAAWERSKESLP